MQASSDAQIMKDRKAPTGSPAVSSTKPASRPKPTPDFVAENLRRLFGEVENEPLPDRFRELLQRLKNEERPK